MDTETKKIGKHHQLPLPFKYSTLSRQIIAEKRLTSLKNRFLRDPKYWSDYKLFIQDFLTKGYARKSAGAPAEESVGIYLIMGCIIPISQKSEL